MTVPELFIIDSMTPLHLAVLLGAAGRDVADAGGLDRQRKGQGKLAAIVDLELRTGKGKAR